MRHRLPWISPLLDGLAEAGRIYDRLRVSRMAAALAFYGLFSLGPLLVIAFSIAGWVLGGDAARGLVAAQIENAVGGSAAETVETLLEVSARGGSGWGATAIAAIVLFYVGSTVFFQVQGALSEIFGAGETEMAGWRVTLWRRLKGFLTILVISALLALAVVINLLAGAALDTVALRAPWFSGAGRWVTPSVSLLVVIGLVAGMYRWLTTVRLPWKAAWRGAVVTAILLVAGTWAVGIYFGTIGARSGAYAAFPLLLLLALFNFLSQALLFGATLTRVYASRLQVGDQTPRQTG